MPNILEAPHNIVDGELLEYNNELCFFYEKETYDKKESEICVTRSVDGGITWSKEKQLLPPTGDNELACVMKDEDRLLLYYSSDYKNPGESNDGARVYRADFNNQYKKLGQYLPIDLSEKKGILLYDILKK